ncbi:MAG: YbaB/EbfC family nucleoid-associated protein [Chloroflexi bacterium]|nr:YbaB/EbfC family nucleoid-associated protein [Chloroflexota bacterium]
MSKIKKNRSGGGRPLPGGGLPGMGGGGNMNNLMGQMRKLQEEMEKTQEALADEEVTATAGGGVVTVVATGAQEIRSITIKPEAVNAEDVELLQDMVLIAVNDALQKSKALSEARLGSLTGGLGLPPGLGL